jgi:hypothetical protein
MRYVMLMASAIVLLLSNALAARADEISVVRMQSCCDCWHREQALS